MYKKILKTLSSLVFGLGLITMIPFVSSSCKQDSKYASLPNDVFKVSGGEIKGFKYTKEELLKKYPKCNTLEIPSEIDGVKITSISESSFFNPISFESFIPNNITNLIFSINSNIELLSSDLFYNAPFKTIDFTKCNDNITIKEECFAGCDISKLILKKNSVGKKYGLATNLGPNANVLIEKNSNGECIFGANTCSVGSIAFGNIILPSDVSEYESKIVGRRQIGAFQGCMGVKSISFNFSITALGRYMFSNTGILSLDLLRTRILSLSLKDAFNRV